jgi:WD40 repeat protein
MNKSFFVLAMFALTLSTSIGLADEKKAASKAIVPEKINLGRPVSFENDIRDIMDFNCVACHNVGTSESKLNLEEAADIVKGGKRGAGIVPGQPDKSLVYLAAARAKTPHMPPLPNKVEAQALTPKELGLLRQWIVEGAKADGDSTGAVVNWQPIPTSMKAIYSLGLSPWGERVAVGRANQVVIYDTNTGSESRLLDPNLNAVKFGDKAMYPDGASHRDFVHSIAFHPNGRTLATGGFRVVKLWDRATDVQLNKTGLGVAGISTATHAEKGLVAIGTQDNKIQIRTIADGKIIKTLEGHTGPVKGVTFTKDGASVISASEDKTVRVWAIATGKATRTITAPAAATAVVVNGAGTLIVSGHQDNIIRTWPIATPTPIPEGGEKPVKELKGHSQPINALAAISTSNAVVSGANDNTARIWNLDSGAATRSLNHGGPVVSVDCRADGTVIVTGSSNNTAKLWTAANGKQIVELRGHFPTKRSEALALETQTLAGLLVKLADTAEKAGDKNAKERADALKKAGEAKTKADTDVAAKKKAFDESKKKADDAKAKAAAKPEDKALAKVAVDTGKDLTKKTDESKTSQETQKSAVRSLDLAKKADAKAKQQLTAAKAEHVKAKTHKTKMDEAFKVAQAATKAAEKPIAAVAFSPDNSRVAVSTTDGVIQIWDAALGQPIDTLSNAGSPIKSLSFVDGNRLVSTTEDKNIIVWDANPAWKLVASLGSAAGDPLNTAMSPFVFRVLSLAFSRDGSKLATGGGDPSRSGELIIWDVAKKSVIRSIEDAHSDTIFGLEFSRDGKQIVSGAADKFVKIHDVATGKHIKSFEGHTHHVLDVSWKADGSSLASAGADNAIKVWNVETGEQRRTITNYSKQVTSIRYMGVSDNVVSCGGDKTVRFHTATNGSNFRSFSGGTDYMYAAEASRDQKIVVAAGEDGAVRIWNGANGQVIKTIEAAVPPAADVQASAKK